MVLHGLGRSALPFRVTFHSFIDRPDNESVSTFPHAGGVFLNFGRYLIVIIDHDYHNEENDLALAVWVAEAEEITAEEASIQDK